MSRLDLADYDFALPQALIAQQPAARRDAARMLVLARAQRRLAHAQVSELPSWLSAGDLLVVNETRVLPARLRGHKQSGGRVELLLLGPGARPGRYRALLRGRARTGAKLRLSGGGRALEAEVAALGAEGEVELAFEPGCDPYSVGETPLPPYIERPSPRAEDAERYQTCYARVPGSVAAPTAGLHLSPELLARLDAAGIELARVVLHVGPGTFRPPRPEDLARGELHPEPYELPARAAAQVGAARARGARVVAVGTTSARVLESCASPGRRVQAGRGTTTLLLAPGRRFDVVDALLTNFHLPRSSLLLLAAAFAGRSAILSAYAEAIARGYRFYSYGDAMLIL